MLELALSLLIMLCLSFGLQLRYLPFAKVITKEQKQLLCTCMAVLSAVSLVLVWWCIHTFDFSLSLAKIMGVAFAVITAGVQMLILRQHTGEQLFVFGVVISINYMLMEVPAYLSYLLNFGQVSWRPYVIVGMYLLLLTATFLPMRRLLQETVSPFFQLETGSYWSLIWLIPVSLFITMMLSYPGETRVDSPVTLISGGITTVMIFLMCRSIAADSRRMLEQKQMAEQLQSQQLYFAELKASIEESRRSRHDLKHKLNAINYYLEQNDLEALRRYCQTLTAENTLQTAPKISGLDLLDGVLFRYSRQAEQEQIRFVCTERCETPWIADMDLCVLLGNALDNAMEACRLATEDRRIAVTIRGDENIVNILVQNTFDGELHVREDVIYSRKEADRIGIGLQSIRKICEKYHGFAEFFVDRHLFSANMVLKRK